MKNLIIHTPEGFRDIYGQEMKRKRTLMRGFEDVFDHYGYEPIETPTVEYFDVFSNEVGTTPSNELYKFFDRDGNTMVLRPDFTPSVCRAVAMHFPKEGMPYRLSYEGSTFVNSQEYQLNLKQATQAGVELIGDGSAKADAEILMLTCDLLKKAGIREFQVSVGEVDFFKSLAAESGLDEETIEQVRSMISNKNFFGVSERLGSADINPVIRRAFADPRRGRDIRGHGEVTRGDRASPRDLELHRGHGQRKVHLLGLRFAQQIPLLHGHHFLRVYLRDRRAGRQGRPLR